MRSNMVNDFNKCLVNGGLSAYHELIRHNHLHAMMKDGRLSNDNAIFLHFEYDVEERGADIAKLSSGMDKDSVMKGNYDREFMEHYFSGNSDY